jgi:predicted dehydrogenase
MNTGQPEKPPDILIVGGGMITHDQLLPAVWHMQRKKHVGRVAVSASRYSTVAALASSGTLREAFPGQTFDSWPARDGPPQPELYRDAIASLPSGSIVIAAVPDQLHFDVVMAAIERNHHVCCVKPLVLRYSQALEIERAAYDRGLVVGIEYHKRFDDRSLMARRKYRAGLFGDFRLGTARLMEKWYYRHSNFQNWCTTENSDAFVYIGCHYVDLVAFITGLEPVAVSVYGIRDRYPNGNEGYLWTDARVIWNNGAALNIQNSLSFPDAAPGTNTQGLTMYCQGSDNGTMLDHSDQYRGLKYSYTQKPDGPGSTVYTEPSPDYFQYVDLGGPGLTPLGYGYRSVEYILSACMRVSAEPALSRRQAMLRELDSGGIMATPANSAYNERLLEAARKSILNGGVEVRVAPQADSRH